MSTLYAVAVTSGMAMNDLCIKWRQQEQSAPFFLVLHSSFTKVTATPFTSYNCTHCCQCLQCTASTGQQFTQSVLTWQRFFRVSCNNKFAWSTKDSSFISTQKVRSIVAFVLFFTFTPYDTKSSSRLLFTPSYKNQGAPNVFFVLVVHKEMP